jgi:hypothetical protein
MRRVVVRYKTKPEASEENQRLVENVFEELNERQPDGLRYATLRLADGVTFVRVAVIETDDGSNPLAESEAFAESSVRSKSAAPSHPRRKRRL